MTLDASVGTSTANSYVTEAEADEYFNNRSYASAWASLESEDKQRFLITSTNLIDWNFKWKGFKTNSEQSLDWPRTNVTRPDGSSVPSDIIPLDVKQATYELTLSSLSTDRTADNPLNGLEEVRVASLSVKAESTGSYSTRSEVIPDQVKKIVSDLTSSGSLSVVRLMRA